MATSNCAAPSSGQGSVTPELRASNSGTNAGNPGGAFATTRAHAVGFNVYQNGKQLASVTALGKGSGNSVDNSAPSAQVTADPNGGAVLIQVFDYANNIVPFTLTKS